MKQENLRGGDIRLAGETCGFLYRRLRPGVLLTLIRGRDMDEFGAAPLEIVEDEYRILGRSVEWFVDASLVASASVAVSNRWTAWLREHADTLSQLHVLSASKETRLMLEIAQHFSESAGRLAIYADRESWTKQWMEASSWLTGARELDDRWEDSPVAIHREQSSNFGVRFSAPGSSWSFLRMGNNAVFSQFWGSDTGDLTGAALDEMERLLSLSSGKISWFLDLADAHNVSARVSQVWTEWLLARRDRLFRVSIFAPTPLFPLVFTVASFSAGLERLVRIHRELRPFQEEMRMAGASIPGGTSLVEIN